MWMAAEGEKEGEVGRIRALHVPRKPLAAENFSAQLSKQLAAKPQRNRHLRAQ